MTSALIKQPNESNAYILRRTRYTTHNDNNAMTHITHLTIHNSQRSRFVFMS